MIRKLLNGDIDRVADIWLKTNLKAHYFISNQYWKSNYELVKEMMSQYEVYAFLFFSFYHKLTINHYFFDIFPFFVGRFRLFCYFCAVLIKHLNPL